MNGADSPPEESKYTAPVQTFLIHLGIFIMVNLALLFVPMIYDGKLDFSLENRGPLFYGSVIWGIGLMIHGVIVLVDWLGKRSKV